MKKKHLIYLYSTSVLLLILGTICFLYVIDFWTLCVPLWIAGIGLFIGTTVYFLIHKITLKKERVLFCVCGAVLAFGLLFCGNVSIIIALWAIGIALFIGIAVYYITRKIKSSKKRIVFYICGYVLSSGLLFDGIASQIYAENYKEYGGFMPGLDALGDWIGNVFCIVLGLIIVTGITGSIIVRRTANKKHMKKDNQ